MHFETKSKRRSILSALVYANGGFSGFGCQRRSRDFVLKNVTAKSFISQNAALVQYLKKTKASLAGILPKDMQGVHCSKKTKMETENNRSHAYLPEKKTLKHTGIHCITKYVI